MTEICIGIKSGFKRKRENKNQTYEPVHKIQKIEVNQVLRKKYKIKELGIINRMTEIGHKHYYSLSFKDAEAINEKGHDEGFTTEIFIRDSKQNLLLYGQGWGKKSKDSKISSCFSVVDKYLEIIESNEIEIELHAQKVKKYTKELFNLIEKVVELPDVDHSVANSTVYITQLCFKLFKKNAITIASKENTILHRCEIKIPMLEDKLGSLIGIGISSNKKSAQNIACENMIIQLMETKLRRQIIKLLIHIINTLLNQKYQNKKKQIKKEYLGLPKKKVENEIQIQLQPISLMKDILHDRYDVKPSETVEILSGKKYRAEYKASIITKRNEEITIIGESIEKNKTDAKRNAAFEFLKKLPRFENENLITNLERNKTYAHILDNYMKYLNDDHAQELESRNLDSKISQKLFLRSWRRAYLSTDEKITKWLPGIIVNENNELVTCGRSGIFIPAFSVLKEIVGAQIKPDRVKKNEKYVWLSSSFENENDLPIYLPNGDVPLFCWVHDEIFKSNKKIEKHHQKIQKLCCPKLSNGESYIGLCEGSLKSLVAAYRLRIPFIGAAGFEFLRSGKTITEDLNYLKPKNLIIFPDAGCVANKQIMVSYFKSIMLFLHLGYKHSMKIAWWNQYDKLFHNDIDEFDEFDDNLKLISVEDFLNEVFSDCRAYLKYKIPYLKDYIQSEKIITMQEIIEIDDEAPIEDEKTFKMKIEEQVKSQNEIKFKREQQIYIREVEPEIICLD
eukprot:gene9043-1140_t